MQLDLVKLKEEFDTHGWVLIKGLFTKSEIEKMRAEALESTKEIGKNLIDLLSDKRVNYVLTDDRIVTITKALLATDNPIYFGDSSISIGNLGQGFHKDNPDRHKPSGPDWKTDDYPCIRMAIYCQDHVNHSGSLALRDMSHKYTDPKKGQPFFVPTEPGDLVVWTLRTTHSGNSMRLKGFPELVINPLLYKYLPGFIFKPEEKLRVALLMTFGKKAPLFDRNLNYLKTRTYMVESWRNSITPPEQIEKLKSKNIEFIDLYEEAKKIDISKTYAAHHDLD